MNTVPAAFNQQINAIVPVDNDPYFILTAMIKNMARFSAIAGKSATAIINKTSFSQFEISIPELSEQQKIADFFKNIDNLVVLHQRNSLSYYGRQK